MVKHIKHIESLDFTVVADVGDSLVSFDIYDIEGWGEGECPGVFDIPLWHKEGAKHYPDSVLDLDVAERYLHGSVKWDGCSDWHFDEQDRNMLHSCSLHGLQRLGDVMTFCWKWTSELLPNFDQ